jgi:WD40 repeat protein
VANSIYTVGGAVQATQGIYIKRRADEDLLALCQSATFAYVLTARQIGKSSLMVSTAERLDALGIRSVIVDLQKFGTQTTAEAWYLDMLDEIANQLRLSTDVVEWWQARGHLGMAHRLAGFFREVLLAEVATPLIVFVDEIDTTLSLPFADDFYTAIRSLYEERTRAPELKRLSFVLIGVATPGDLIRDSKRTPFNIGQRVDLTDFSFEEALPFAEGFGQPPRKARRLLGWVLGWTGGHPYLTQRLCRALALQNRPRWSRRDVAQLVATTFFGEKSQQDNNLQFVRDMLTRRAPDRTEVLTTYRRIYRGRPAVADEEQSIVKNHLKLSGIARREGSALRVRNQIYQTVFDPRWIQEHLPTTGQDRLRRVRRMALAIIGPLFMLSVVLAGYASSLAVKAEQGRQAALAAEQRAKTERLNADSERTLAIFARATAEASEQAALSSAQTAVAAQAISDGLSKTAATRALDLAVQSASTANPELSLMIAIEGAINDPANPLVKAILSRAIRDSHLRSLLQGHTAEITAVAFSPDGKQTVTASTDTTARIWDWNGIVARPVVVLQGHKKGIRSVAYSPDGQYIATASQDTTVQIWNAATGEGPLEALKANSEPVYSVAFSPDGRLLVTASRDSVVRIWDWRARTLLEELSGHRDLINTAVFSPDGTRILTASRDKTARVWAWDSATGTGTPLTTLVGHASNVYSAAFSPDGRSIVTASQDGTARIWPAGGGEPTRILRENATLPALYSAAFSPDGRSIVIASLDGTAQIWDLQSATETPRTVLLGHSARIWFAAFSPDGAQIVTASADSTARVWAASSSSSTEALPDSMNELIALARTRVTRELTSEERQQFFAPAITPTLMR